MKKQRGHSPTIHILNSFRMFFLFFLRLILMNTISIHVYSDSSTWESHRLCFLTRKAKDSLCQCARDYHYSLSNMNTRKLLFACKGLDGENGNLQSINPCTGEIAIPLLLPHRVSVTRESTASHLSFHLSLFTKKSSHYKPAIIL